jgi:hypothetical protein
MLFDGIRPGWVALTAILAGSLTGLTAQDRMALAPVPLLEAEPADRPIDGLTALRLAGAGARVLAGDADHVTLNGIDRWTGGVHLSGRHARWRWDDGTETITAGTEET